MLLLLRVGIPTCRFSHESSQSHVLASSVVDSFRVSELGEPYWPDHARVPAPLTASGTGSLPSRSRPNTFHVLQPAMIENERLGRYARRSSAPPTRLDDGKTRVLGSMHRISHGSIDLDVPMRHVAMSHSLVPDVPSLVSSTLGSPPPTTAPSNKDPANS